MAFTLPTFNITVNIWRLQGAGGAYVTPSVISLANLTPGKRVMVGKISGATVSDQFDMELLLPALTDIRAFWNGTAGDLVEAPAGTNRFYIVTQVDDIGKGFPNEHRIAWMQYSIQGALNFVPPIVAPVPLP